MTTPNKIATVFFLVCVLGFTTALTFLPSLPNAQAGSYFSSSQEIEHESNWPERGSQIQMQSVFTPDLSITPQACGHAIGWDHDASFTEYELWRSPNPYLHPNDADAELVASYDSGNVASAYQVVASLRDGDSSSHYYVLQASGNGTVLLSNRFGIFDFPLVAGGSGGSGNAGGGIGFPPQLSVHQVGKTVFSLPGEKLVYTIAYTNTGGLATNVILSETLSAYADFDPADNLAGWQVGNSPKEISYDLGTIQPCAAGSITVSVQMSASIPPSVTIISNTVGISEGGASSSEAVLSDNSDVVETVISQGPTSVCGTVAIDTVWTASESPYLVTCPLVINPSITLTMEPGTVVKLGRGILVYGKLVANGAESGKIIFTSLRDDGWGGDSNGDGTTTTPAAGDWGGVRIESTGEALIDHGVLNYGGDYLANSPVEANGTIVVDGEGLITLTHSEVSYSENRGVRLFGDQEDAIIENNQFSHNLHAIRFESSGYRLPANTDLSSNEGVSNTHNTIYLSGHVTGTTTLGASDTLVYEIERIYVLPDSQLTIEPGAILKIERGILVYGELIANGTETDKIVFTSLRDDDWGGDTNGDGTATTPTAGDWGGIRIESTGEVLINHGILKYGGDYLANSPVEANGTIVVDGGGLITLTHSEVSYSENRGVRLFGDQEDAIIENNQFSHNLHAIRFESSGYRLPANTDLSSNEGVNNTHNTIYLSGQMSGTTTLGASDTLVYEIERIYVLPDSQLTIEPGAILKIERGILVYGELIANGTETDKIVFTSLRDDDWGGDTNGDGTATTPAAGDWGGIRIESTGEVLINHGILKYGGDYLANSPVEANGTIVVDGEGLITLTHSEVSYSENRGVRLFGDQEDAIIENNQFSHNLHAIRFESSGYRLPANTDLSSNEGVSNTHNTIYLSGHVTGTTTLGASDTLVYEIERIYVLPDSQLTIEPGAILKIERGILVYGELIANGTETDKIVFTSLRDDDWGGDTNGDGTATTPTAGDWGGIRIESTGEVLINHGILKYGGDYLANSPVEANGTIVVDGEGLITLTHSEVSYSENRGVRLFGDQEDAIIENNQFSHNLHAIRFESSGYRLPANTDLSSNEGVNNTHNTIYLSGQMSGTTTLGASDTLVYEIERIYVLPDSQLTIEPGAILKIERGILVYGELIANGTETDKIVFTSLRDDDWGGDTNGDGTATTPAAGDWGGIRIESTGEVLINHGILKYGGDYVANSPVEANGTIVVDGEALITLTYSEVSYSENRGVRLLGDQEDAIIENNQFSYNLHAIRFESSGYRLPANTDLSSNEGVGNTHNTIYLSGYMIGTTTLGASSTLVYEIEQLYVSLDSQLTIEPGAILKIEKGISVQGKLIANGTEADKIVFTSLRDDDWGGDTNGDGTATTPAPGDWGGIRIHSTGELIINYGVLKYGGDSVSGSLTEIGGLIYVSNTSAMRLTNSELSYSENYGIRNDNAGVSTIRYNTFAANQSYAIYNHRGSERVVDARNNYWGQSGGPDLTTNANSVNTYSVYSSACGCYLYPWAVDFGSSTGSQTGEESIDLIDNALPEPPVRNTAEPEPGVPYILGVESNKGFFLLGLNEQGFGYDSIQLTADVDWNGSDPGLGSPGQAFITVNGHSGIGSVNPNGFTYDLPVSSLGTGFSQMEIKVTNVDNIPSQPLVTEIFRFVAPEWLVNLGATQHDLKLEVTVKPGYTEARATVSFPIEPFKLDLSLPEAYPFVGGQTGVRETQAGFSLFIRDDGNGGVELYGETGFVFKSKNEIRGRLTGTANVGSIRHGAHLTGGQFGVEIGGTIVTKEPVLAVIPAIAVVSNIPGVDKFLETVYVEGKIEPTVGTTFAFESNSAGSELEWTGVEGSGSLKLTLALGVGVGENFDMRVYGGGEGTLTFHSPPAPDYLKDATGSFFVGASTKFLGFETKTEKIWSWSYPPEGQAQAGAGLAIEAPFANELGVAAQDGSLLEPLPEIGAVTLVTSTTAWGVAQPDYAGTPYASFVATEAIGLSRVVAATAAQQETLIVSNLYDQANPSLALNGLDEAALVWVHDDIAKLASQSKEIYASWWNGAGWSAPTAVTNDTMSDLNPQTIAISDTQTLAVGNDSTIPASL